jgi:uncharacterized protein (DUF2236 family)
VAMLMIRFLICTCQDTTNWRSLLPGEIISRLGRWMRWPATTPNLDEQVRNTFDMGRSSTGSKFDRIAASASRLAPAVRTRRSHSPLALATSRSFQPTETQRAQGVAA